MSQSVSNTTTTSLKPNALQDTLLSIITVAFTVVCLALFFTSPLPNSRAPRWALLLAPTVNENFVNEIWFGVNLPQASITYERFIAFGLGLIFVVASGIIGALLLRPITRTLSLNLLEKTFFSCGVGLALTSTVIFFLGAIHRTHFWILPETIIVVLAGIVYVVYNQRGRTVNRLIRQTIQSVKLNLHVKTLRRFDKISLICLAILLVLFSSFYAFSSSQPIFEYDAVEYHLQGAREIYESNSIAFSKHNVYANMPLGAELFYVIGFNMAHNVGYNAENTLRIGSLIGKTIITSFVYLTAIGIIALSRRFFANVVAGLWAALAFMSFPGTFEAYASGLNDCILSFLLLSASYVLLIRAQLYQVPNYSASRKYYVEILLGVFLGFAAAVKYTSVVFICIPAIVVLILEDLFPTQIVQRLPHLVNQQNSSSPAEQHIAKTFIDEQSAIQQKITFSKRLSSALTALLLVIASSLIVGCGWYVRNTIATGNPVYPLAYSIFGDSTETWNDSINQRWRHAHSSTEFGTNALGGALSATLWKDDMASPLFILTGIASCFALFIPNRRVNNIQNYHEPNVVFSSIPLLKILIGLVILFWCFWFLTTHRLTRFLLPIAPFTALVFGIFVSFCLGKLRSLPKIIVLCLILTSFLYSGLMIDLLGQGRMAPLKALERDTLRFTPESIYFNDHADLFTGASPNEEPNKLLLIGDAKAFMYRVPLLYSTCWNDSPLLECIQDSIKTDSSSGEFVEITNAQKISACLKKAHIKFILVDYSELARFRSKGNYGYNNPEITSALFQHMKDQNIITPFTIKEQFSHRSDAVQIFEVN